MSKFSHYLNFNQSANSWDPARSCSMSDIIWALSSGVALRWSPYDVTQQAPWQPPFGVRRLIQERSQLYNKRVKYVWNNIYGLLMSSFSTLSIHLLCIFFSFIKAYIPAWLSFRSLVHYIVNSVWCVLWTPPPPPTQPQAQEVGSSISHKQKHLTLPCPAQDMSWKIHFSSTTR